MTLLFWHGGNICLAEQEFTLVLSGIDEPLRENVMAYLSLAKQPQPLDDLQFNRLYNKAAEETRKALEPFGYYSSDVTVSHFWEEDELQVHVEVDPGKPVRVAELNIDIKGPGRDEEDIVKAIGTFPLQRGNVFEHQVYEQGKRKLLAAALDQGYHKVAFATSSVRVSRQELAAEVELSLDTGPLFLFGPITYENNMLTEKLLQKIASCSEGDRFSPRALTRMRQSLVSSGYFSKAEVSYDIAAADSDRIPVTVSLTPNLANKYGLGAGYGTDTGIRGNLEWHNRYLNRYGHLLDLQWQPSERKSYVGGVYTIPLSDPKKERLSLRGKFENENFDNTETKTWSSTVGYDRLTDKGEYNLFLTYLDEDYETGLDFGNSILLTPGVKATLRIADNRLVTRHGISLAATVTGGHDQVVSDTTFLQGMLAGKAITTPMDNWRLIGRCELGSTATDDIYDLPPSLRFYAGGDQSVRGYGYKRIGPKDAAGNVIGGRYLFTYSLEVERSLSEQWAAALFFDSGTAFNSFSNVSMQSGAGGGIRWKASFGQIRVDVARQVEENSWRLHLTIGADL